MQNKLDFLEGALKDIFGLSFRCSGWLNVHCATLTAVARCEEHGVIWCFTIRQTPGRRGHQGSPFFWTVEGRAVTRRQTHCFTLKARDDSLEELRRILEEIAGRFKVYLPECVELNLLERELATG